MATTPATRPTKPSSVVALCSLIARVVIQGWGATFRLAFIFVIVTACLVTLTALGDMPGLSARP